MLTDIFIYSPGCASGTGMQFDSALGTTSWQLAKTSFRPCHSRLPRFCMIHSCRIHLSCADTLWVRHWFCEGSAISSGYKDSTWFSCCVSAPDSRRSYHCFSEKRKTERLKHRTAYVYPVSKKMECHMSSLSLEA